MTEQNSKGRSRYWIAAVWAVYLYAPWHFGVLFLNDWECSVMESIRWFFACIGYITVGAAIYVLTGLRDDKFPERVSRGLNAVVVLAILAAVHGALHLSQCPY